MKKYLKVEMKNKGLTPPKLAVEIGKLCSRQPTDATVWGWANERFRPTRKEWIKALADIFEIEHGEQFFFNE